MRRCGLVLVAVAAALLAAPAGAAAEELEWGACPPLRVTDPRQECATLTVPLDYAGGSERTIEIAVSRIRTAAPGARRGVLLYNPGGPGSGGLDGPARLAARLPQSVQERYDLIGFDPRGIGYSAPVSCALAPADLDVHKFIPYPERDLDIAANVAYARRAAAGCAATSGDVLPYISTANTARDMDRIRSALGESRISYAGFSYGTYLGAVYMQLFPGRADRFILDSNVHPRRIWRETFASWGYAVEVAFTGFTRFAAERHATYGLGATPQAVYAKTLELIAELEAEPYPHPEWHVLVTGEFFRELIRNAGLRNDSAFPNLAAEFARIDARDVTTGVAGGLPNPLRSPAPAHAGAAGAFPTPPYDNEFASPWAVVCGDADWPSSPALYQRDVLAYDRLFPIHGRAAANIWPCAFWAFEPREPAVPIRALKAGQALVVQSIRDPATPYDGGVAMRAALGARSRLVSVQDGAHVVAFNSTNACADRIATAFLVRGELGSDHFCARDAPAAERSRTPVAHGLLAPGGGG